jgi:hypothetical protein
MPIFYKDKKVIPSNIDNKIIAYIFYGSKLVYESIASCFAKGFWVNEQPWSNKSEWKN